MPFSPHEIENREFVVSLRGYSRDEVRAFLRAVAIDYRAALEGQRPENGAELVARPQGVSIRPSGDDSGGQTALLRHRADAEAAEVRAAAEHQARLILEDAKNQAAEIRESVERLTSERLEDVTRRTDELRELEERMGRRLYFLETALELARRDLGIDGSSYSIRDDRDREGFPVSAKQYLPPGASTDS